MVYLTIVEDDTPDQQVRNEEVANLSFRSFAMGPELAVGRISARIFFSSTSGD